MPTLTIEKLQSLVDRTAAGEEFHLKFIRRGPEIKVSENKEDHATLNSEYGDNQKPDDAGQLLLLDGLDHNVVVEVLGFSLGLKIPTPENHEQVRSQTEAAMGLLIQAVVSSYKVELFVK